MTPPDSPDDSSGRARSHPHHGHAAMADSYVNEAAAVVRRSRFSVLWVIPIISVTVSGWLAWRHFASEGPLITISFDTVAGIVPGQTQVKDRAVTLGMVENVTLTKDLKHAMVKVRMNSGTGQYLSNYSRFWVVRPQINGASVTGLDTLISGAYIALDPGVGDDAQQDRTYQTHFVGLETPPGLRSDQPGSTFWLLSSHLGSLGAQAPVFYRDIPVGEVVGYTLPPSGEGPFMLQVFVRAPYDRYLHPDSRFWNVTGLQIGFGAGGLKIRLQSLQALLSGGVAFGLPDPMEELADPSQPVAVPNSLYWLYETQAAAEDTRFKYKIHLVSYFHSPVGTLTEGSQVKLYGVQVGVVSDTALEVAPNGDPQVRVDMMLEPGRLKSLASKPVGDETRKLAEQWLYQSAAQGMHASVQDASLLTGEAEISLLPGDAALPKAKWAQVKRVGDIIVLPSQTGGYAGLMQSASAIAAKIAKMPLQQIGENLNGVLAGVDKQVNSPEMTQSVKALRDSLVSLNKVLNHADRHLPQLMDNMTRTLASARAFLHAYNGGDVNFSRNLNNMIVQLSRAAHSLRLLMDYYDNHPSSIIVGRSK